MVSKEDVLIFVPVAFLLIIVILGLSGVFSAEMPGAGENCNLPDAVCGLGTAIGFPKEWLNTKTFLWYSLIPLLGVWLIIFGFLDRIHIFGRPSINGLLSFLIAFSMVPLGIFVMIVSIIFSIMGIYSVALFVGLFILGTGFLARDLYYGWRYYGLIKQELGIYDEDYRRLQKAEKDLKKERNKALKDAKDWKRRYDQGKVDKAIYLKEIGRLRRYIAELEARLGGVQLEKKKNRESKKRADKRSRRERKPT